MTVVQLPCGIHVAGCQPANQAQVRVRGSADSSGLQTRIPCHVLRTGLAIGLRPTRPDFIPPGTQRAHSCTRLHASPVNLDNEAAVS